MDITGWMHSLNTDDATNVDHWQHGWNSQKTHPFQGNGVLRQDGEYFKRTSLKAFRSKGRFKIALL